MRRETRPALNHPMGEENESEQKEASYMKRVLTGTFLAATFAVGLSAQSPTPSSPPSTSPSSPSSPSAQSPSYEPKDTAKGGVTVTGCLKAGDSADSFILSDLKFSDKKAPGAVGTSGSAPAPAAIASATTLKLNPGSAKLTDHIGHMVEVTGAVGSKSDMGAGAGAAPSASPSAGASASSGPSLDVKSVKMVSESCTSK
jgi:hypothetical protein